MLDCPEAQFLQRDDISHTHKKRLSQNVSIYVLEVFFTWHQDGR